MQWASDKYGVTIGRSTIADILKDTTKWTTLERNADSIRQTKPMYQEMESALMLWFNDIRQRGGLISDELLREKARHFGERLGVTNFAYSNGRLANFKQRNKIKSHNLQGESASVDRDVVNEGRAELQDIHKIHPYTYIHKILAV